jgi:hypothetical protein
MIRKLIYLLVMLLLATPALGYTLPATNMSGDINFRSYNASNLNALTFDAAGSDIDLNGRGFTDAKNATTAQGLVTYSQLNSKMQGWINVKDYGAKGDNSTDDTDAIQSATNSSIGKCVVYFPPGKYVQTRTIYTHSGVSWIGSGATYGYYCNSDNLNGSYLIKKQSWSGPMVEYNTTGITPLEGGFSIYNMGFVSDRIHHGTGIKLIDAYNYNIEKCLVDGMMGCGIELHNCGPGEIASNQIFDTMPDGTFPFASCGILLDNCNDLQIHDNNIGTADYLRSLVTGIEQVDGWASITDNIIFNGYFGIHFSGFGLIVGNRINDCYESCVYFTAPDVLVVGNHLYSQTTGPWSSTFVGISIGSNTHNSVVVGNDIHYLNCSGSQLGIYNNCINTTVLGNTANIPICAPQISWSDGVPVSGYHWRGSVVWDSTPTAGSAPGWICTADGTPGTFSAMAVLA